MVQLLKIEWLKIKNYMASTVIGLFFLFGILIANYVVYLVKNEVDKTSPMVGALAGSAPYDFEQVWQTTSYVSGCLLLLPGLLLIILMTNEFTYKTHRQNIIDGWSRQQFIDVKLMLVLVLTSMATLMVIITALIFGFSSGTSFSLEHFESVGYFFLKALSYNMIAMLMATLIRKTGFAIGVFVVYLCAENIISVLLEVWSGRIKGNHHIDLGNMGDYLPMNASDGMLHFPNNTITNMAKNSDFFPSNYLYVTLPLAILYLVLFVWWSRNRIIKTDL
jgi:hypothetical protein